MVQLWNQLRLQSLKAMVQGVHKEAVIAVPLSLFVQGDEKQVRPFKSFQHGLAVVARQDRIAQQDGLDRRRLRGSQRGRATRSGRRGGI